MHNAAVIIDMLLTPLGSYNVMLEV